MKIVLSGKVVCGDTTRTGYANLEPDGAVLIGGQDLVLVVQEAKFTNPVTIAIASDFLLGNTTFQGVLSLQEGWGYSEYTPIDSDQLFVGDHDILDILSGLEGKDVTVWIADEPINILEGATINDPQ